MTEASQEVPHYRACATRRLNLGAYGTTHEVRKALQNSGHEMDLHASNILNKLDMVSGEVVCDVVENYDIGLLFGGGLRETFSRAKGFGLLPCHPIVGPLLCLEVWDEAESFEAIVVMKPVVGFMASAKHFYKLRVDRGIPSLTVTPEDYEAAFGKETRFVFVRKAS